MRYTNRRLLYFTLLCFTLLYFTLLVLFLFTPSSPDSVGEGITLSGCPSIAFVRPFVRPSVRPFVRSSGPILLPRYLIKGFRSLDKTCREYVLTHTDDLMRFWRSKVKVTVGIHVDASAIV